MQITANQFNRNPGQVFREAAKGEIVTIKHDQHPDYMFQMFARKKFFALEDETKITDIANDALGKVALEMNRPVICSGLYADYAVKVAAEVFRQIVYYSGIEITRDKALLIAREIESIQEPI